MNPSRVILLGLIVAALLWFALAGQSQDTNITAELQRRSVRVTPYLPAVPVVPEIGAQFITPLPGSASASFPPITPAISRQPDEPGTVRVWFNAKRGWFYQIQGAADLAAPVWTNLGPQIVGIGRRMNFPLQSGAAGMGFFRVLEAPNAPGSLQFTPSGVVTNQ